jgi:hypothetical protein
MHAYKMPAYRRGIRLTFKAGELTSILDRQIAELRPQREGVAREAPISNAAEAVIVES